MLGRRGRRAAAGGGGRARQRLLHLGLRSRITLGFAFGALVLSSALAAITYFTTRSQIVGQELTTLQHQAYTNALELYNEVANPPATSAGEPASTGAGALAAIINIDQASSNGKSPATASLLYTKGEPWVVRSPSLGPRILPASLKARVLATGAPAYQVFETVPQVFGNASPGVAVAVPIPAMDAIYFEVFPLTETSRTLQIILAALAAAGVITTIAGAVLGRWAAGRALRPLHDVSQAALAIASGRLGTRLETADARDLAVLTSSFNRMVDRLQQRIERDAQFTSDVSHELRSPLTTLAASLSVIEARREELPERSQRALELVGAEIRRFQRMVGELLEISRLDAGSADFEANLVPIGELVRRAVESSRGHLRAEPLPVVIDPGVERRKVVADKRRFERILTNLLENAERYGGGATRVSVEGGKDQVRIAVEDAGPGVPPGEQERIFQRFARGSVAAGSRGTGGGTGLGLALVTEHVKLHGGRVWVEPRKGGGARFVVELPLAQRAALAEALEDDAEGEPAEAPRPASGLPTPRSPPGGRRASGREPPRRRIPRRAAGEATGGGPPGGGPRRPPRRRLRGAPQPLRPGAPPQRPPPGPAGGQRQHLDLELDHLDHHPGQGGAPAPHHLPARRHHGPPRRGPPLLDPAPHPERLSRPARPGAERQRQREGPHERDRPERLPPGRPRQGRDRAGDARQQLPRPLRVEPLPAARPDRLHPDDQLPEREGGQLPPPGRLLQDPLQLHPLRHRLPRAGHREDLRPDRAPPARLEDGRPGALRDRSGPGRVALRRRGAAPG